MWNQCCARDYRMNRVRVARHHIRSSNVHLYQSIPHTHAANGSGELVAGLSRCLSFVQQTAVADTAAAAAAAAVTSIRPCHLVTFLAEFYQAYSICPVHHLHLFVLSDVSYCVRCRVGFCFESIVCALFCTCSTSSCRTDNNVNQS